MRIRAVYEKGDQVRFLGHLDVQRSIQLSIFRAKWPIEMSQGFSPRPKLSVYSPLPVGVAGREEYFDATLSGHPDLAELARSLTRALPEGFGLRSLYLAPEQEEPFEERIRASSYLADIKEVNRDKLKESLDAFMSAPRVLFEVRRPKETKTVDLRPFVLEVGELEETEDGRLVFTIGIAHENGRTVRPQWVISSLAKFGLDLDAREAIFDRRKIIFG